MPEIGLIDFQISELFDSFAIIATITAVIVITALIKRKKHEAN